MVRPIAQDEKQTTNKRPCQCSNINKQESGKMKVKVRLTINELENLNAAGLEEGCLLMVKIEWVGSKKKIRYLGKAVAENHTSTKPVQADGVVCWSEEFDQSVRLKRIKSEGYKRWFVYLKVLEVKNDSRKRSLLIQPAKLDITEGLVMGSQRTLGVPINFRIRGKITTVMLKVDMQITECQAKLRSRFSFKRATSSLLFCSCSGVESCVPSIQNAGASRGRGFSTSSHKDDIPGIKNQVTDCSSSECEAEPSYRILQLCNFYISQFECEGEGEEDTHIPMYGSELPVSPDLSPNKKQQEQNQHPIKKFLSRVSSSKKDEQPKGVPLLNKSRSDIGGDDIDIQRHKESDTSHISGNTRSSKVHPEEVLHISRFEDDEPFEVGNWERRSIRSRDGELELLTDVFLATIDQRSEKVSGGSACAALAAVIADWLQKNPGVLPLRCQLDQLVREGSSIWRELCQVERHRERFPDLHFDLKTVLEEKVTSLREEVKWSYIGFFGVDELQEGAECLKEAMSFDSIWDKIVCDGMEMEYQVYICSWNDHFFVVKMERDAIYLIDTFGERLFEGCKQAYILKFDEGSIIYREQRAPATRTQVSGKEGEKGSHEEEKMENQNEEDRNHEKSKHYSASNEEIERDEEKKKESGKETATEDVEAISKEEIEDSESSREMITEDGEASSVQKEERERDEKEKKGIETRGEREEIEGRCKCKVSEGLESCREYIKGFLASLAVRQLQMEMMRMGSIQAHPIHQRLQIEFHYVAACTSTTD